MSKELAYPSILLSTVLVQSGFLSTFAGGSRLDSRPRTRKRILLAVLSIPGISATLGAPCYLLIRVFSSCTWSLEMAVGVGVGGAVQFVQFNATRMPVLINSRLPFTPSRRAGLFLSISSIGCFLPYTESTRDFFSSCQLLFRWMILLEWKITQPCKEPSKYLFLSLFNANRVLPVVVERTNFQGKCIFENYLNTRSILDKVSNHLTRTISCFVGIRKFDFKVQSLRRMRWNSRVRRLTCNYICLSVCESSISVAHMECCSHVERSMLNCTYRFA